MISFFFFSFLFLLTFREKFYFLNEKEIKKENPKIIFNKKKKKEFILRNFDKTTIDVYQAIYIKLNNQLKI